MNIDFNLLWIFIACAAVTFLPRVLPFALIRRIRMPVPIQRWLSYIPICLLTALVVEGAIQDDGAFLSVDWRYVLILIPTFVTAVWSRSLVTTVLVGVISAALLRWLL